MPNTPLATDHFNISSEQTPGPLVTFGDWLRWQDISSLDEMGLTIEVRSSENQISVRPQPLLQPDRVARIPAQQESRRRISRPPVILLVTPELSESGCLGKNGEKSPCLKAGGLGDSCALLLDSLSGEGMEVHVAMPHYSKLIPNVPGPILDHLHLCEDGEFEHRRSVYDCGQGCNLRAALAFQRHVIRHVIPRIRPDVVHCHDWMTGLVPAAAAAMGVSSLFTVHNLHDSEATLAGMMSGKTPSPNSCSPPLTPINPSV